jgi:hypothetical protein
MVYTAHMESIAVYAVAYSEGIATQMVQPELTTPPSGAPHRL